jgi:hypothetical protein
MTKIIDQPTKAPTRKVMAGGIGSGVVGVPLATLLAALLAQAGIELTPEAVAAVASLLSTVLGLAAAYFAREKA